MSEFLKVERIRPVIAFLFGAIMLMGCAGASDIASKEVVAEKLKAGALVVDVRTPGEFEAGHFSGAVNINIDEVPQRLDEFGPKDQPIVVYCASGRRSGRARKILMDAGYQDVTNGGGLPDMKQLEPGGQR